MDFKLLMFAGVLSLVLGCHSQSTLIDRPSRVENTAAENTGLLTVGNVSSASPKVALSDGPGIAALFNKNYNENTDSCIQYGTGQVRGYYWCSGVVLRTVDNGNFDPWVPSPQALDFRATSFSWIRHDVGTDNLYLRAGFILLSLADVIAQTVPGTYGLSQFKCIYPFDAWTTRTMKRGYFGCDFEGGEVGSPIADSPWGSCDNLLKYTSSAQWDDNFRRHGQISYNQCSWNADNPQGWRNMIASRKNFSGQSSWNELMFRNGGHQSDQSDYTEVVRKGITAFFYQSHRGGSLAEAQTFQRKLSASGRRVPILKLDFSAPAASRFQYIAADQVAYP